MEKRNITHDIKKTFELSLSVRMGTCFVHAINAQFCKSSASKTSMESELFVFCSFKNMIQKAIHRHCFSDPGFFSCMSSPQQKEMVKRICSALKDFPTARGLNRMALRRLVINVQEFFGKHFGAGEKAYPNKRESVLNFLQF